MSGTSPSAVAGQSRYLPKIVTVLREGYGWADLRADALAGLTVAIVALPLSMAIAIASGVGPERGLYTAIVGGFLVSVLGGSRFQIGGPAGAFIVLVGACVAQIGLPGLMLATILSGGLLLALGALRLGGYIRLIPYPVTLGFTAGIAVVILVSQLRDLFGLALPEGEHGGVVERLAALWSARGSVSPAAMVMGFGTILLILGLRRFAPRVPALLAAVGVMSVIAALGLPVETIGSRFGALPRSLPMPALPPLDLAALVAAAPWAVSFALLGAIESLLSAVVADGMTGRRHRADAELVAQGLANIGSGLFGGFCVTGTIARTATNVRAGSHGPMSGMLHAVFLALALLIAAPLAAFIPLAALAGLLALVAWNMAERHEIAALLRKSRAEAAVMLITFLLVLLVDLITGIVAGFALSALLVLRRVSEGASLITADEAHLMRWTGPMFFGSVARLAPALDAAAMAAMAERKALRLDLSGVTVIDASGAYGLRQLAAKLALQDGELRLEQVRPDLGATLLAPGEAAPGLRILPSRAAPDRSAG